MMEFETLNTDKLLMMMKVWICAKKIVAAECHLHRRRRASWFTSQIFFCSQFLIITLQGSAILSLQQQRYY